MSRSSNRNAFTLVELLVVVAIISILIALLLPALKNAKEVSVRTKCVSNMRTLGTALEFYLNDYDNQIPHSGYFGATPGGYDWAIAMSLNTSNGGPAGSINYTPGGFVSNNKSKPPTGVWGCPTIYGQKTFISSTATARAQYGANLYLFTGALSSPPCVKSTQVSRTADIITITEYNMTDQDNMGLKPAYANVSVPLSLFNDFDVGMNGISTPTYPSPTINLRYRHLNTCNAVFLDGHVESMPKGSVLLGAFKYP